MQAELITAGAALLGALCGSLAPIVVGRMNTTAESRREHLRIATQLALAEHQHLMDQARATANRAGGPIPVAPIAATFDYHLELLRLAEIGRSLEPEDFVRLRQRSKLVMDALIQNDPDQQVSPPSTGGAV